MAWPPGIIDADKSPGRPSSPTEHPDHHNQLAAAINDTVGYLTQITPQDIGAATLQQGELASTAVQPSVLSDAIDGRQPYTGIGNRDQLSLSYSNRQVTITGNTEVWLDGIKTVFPGPFIFSQHPATSGGWFFYFDQEAAPTVSATPWNLKLHAPVAYVYYSASIEDGIAFYELHDAHRDPLIHYRMHFVDGTSVEEGSGFVSSGFILNSDLNTSKAIAISSGRIWDEDIGFTCSAVPDGGPYFLMYRLGPTDWVWQVVQTVPFLSDAGNIAFNQFTGETWQLTGLSGNSQFVNVWVFATTALESNRQIFFVPGQRIFTDQATAEAESLGDIDWGNIPFQEIAPLYQLTYRRANGNGGEGKADLRKVARLTGNRSNISQGGVSPTAAAAITMVPQSGLTSTNVQSGLEELSLRTDSGQYPVNIVDISGPAVILPATHYAHSVTMTENCIFSFSSPTSGQTFQLRLSGSFQPTFPPEVQWDNGLAPTYSSPSLYSFTTLDSGVSWMGTLIGAGFS